jgi:hypothetical protein
MEVRGRVGFQAAQSLAFSNRSVTAMHSSAYHRPHISSAGLYKYGYQITLALDLRRKRKRKRKRKRTLVNVGGG